MIGKVSPDDLAALVLSRTGVDDAAVTMGPAYGEDAAAIDLGDRILVVNSDPISLAADRIGQIGVHVACNDVAASGGEPRWITTVIFLPGGNGSLLDTITRQLDREAREVGVSIVGGHTEYVPALSRPVLSLTCLGITDRFVPTAGANPGDVILLAGSAAIEGTGILATDFAAELDDPVPAHHVETARTFLGEIGVVDAALAIRRYASAMHDPTEGGVLGGLVEMAVASGATFEVERELVPIRRETATICKAMDVDPLRTFGSGALLATVPETDGNDAVDALEAVDVRATVVGRVVDGPPEVRLNGRSVRDPVRDDLYDLWS